jgi:hypothetical protein
LAAASKQISGFYYVKLHFFEAGGSGFFIFISKNLLPCSGCNSNSLFLDNYRTRVLSHT